MICPFSYNFWAIDIILCAPTLSLLIPACWRVDVINGGGGDFEYGFSWISDTTHLLSSSFAINCSAFSLVKWIKSFDFRVPVFLSKSLPVAICLPSLEISVDSNSFLSILSVAVIEWYSFCINFNRSRSLSIIILIAGLCTLPADSFHLTFDHNIFDTKGL